MRLIRGCPVGRQGELGCVKVLDKRSSPANYEHDRKKKKKKQAAVSCLNYEHDRKKKKPGIRLDMFTSMTLRVAIHLLVHGAEGKTLALRTFTRY